MHERTRNGSRESRPVLSFVVAACAVALTFGMMTAAPAAAQSLVNGNFEGSPQTNPYASVGTSGYLDAAHSWKVTLGDVNVGTGPAATRCTTTGGHCVDLNGVSRGRIEQVIVIASGAKCSVTFMMSRHLQLASSSATLKTFVNNIATSPASFTHNASGLIATDGKWQSQGFTFQATGPTTTLAFESAQDGAAGPQVDDVTINCTKPTPTGTLTVSKVVVNATGGAAPIPTTFNMVTHCSANAASQGANTPVNVPPNASVSLANQVAAGSLCSVTETTPPHIARLESCKGQGATWTVSYSPPVTIVNGSTSVLTVTNTLTCDPPTGGVLQVHKTVVNTLGVPSQPNWPMTATCTGVPQISLMVPSGGTVQAGGQLPAGTVCSVVEAKPPQVLGVKACPSGTASWVMTNPGPQTIQLAATTAIIITNTLTCDKPTGTTGSLKVIKSVSNMTNGSVTMPTTYPMSVTCTPSGPSGQALSVPPDPTGVTVSNIAASSQCVVTEAALPPITNVKACDGGNASWTTMGSPSTAVTILSGGTATVTIRNTLRCDPPTVSDYDVGIRKSSEDRTLTPGQTGTFTLHPFNNGPSAVGSATGVTVTDTLPANFTPPVTAAGAGPGWTCVVSGLVVTCVYNGPAVAAHQPLPTIKITAVAGREGGYRNCAWITMNRRIYTAADTPIKDTNPRDNSGCVDGRVGGDGGGQDYDVGITKKGPSGAVMVGQAATFTLTAVNTGPAPVNAGTGATVTDTLPVNFTAPITAMGNSAGWSCSVAGRVVTCVWTGAAVGPHENFPGIAITAVAGSEGGYRNCANIELTPRRGERDGVRPGGRVIKDANPRDNKDCVEGRIEAGKKSFNLNIRKLGGGTVAAGSPITFSFDVFNLGPDAVAGITVVDTLPAGLTNVVAPTGSPWNCTVSGSVLTCVYSGGPIALNLHFPAVNIQATAQNPGSFSNCAKVTINGASDSDMQDNRDCRAYRVTGRPTASITIVKDASPDDPQDFQFAATGTGVFDFVLDDDPSNGALPNKITFNNLTPGTYNFSEGAMAGWTSGGTGYGGTVNCTDIPHPTRSTFTPTTSSVSIALVAGDEVTCTFINTKRPAASGFGTVSIIKDASPDDAQDFFFLFGTSGGSFVLDDDGINNNPYPNQTTLPGLAAGPWTFTENAVNGWTLTGIVCTPATGTTPDVANRKVTVNVTNGASITCKFTNTKRPPAGTATLTIIKDAAPDNAQDFHYTVSGPGISNFSLDDDPSDAALPSSKTFTGLATGVSFTVTEDGVAGWTVPSLQCIPDIIGTSTTYTDQLNRTMTVSMAPGVHMTCVFKNVK